MGQNVKNPCDQPILSLRADLYGSQTVIQFLGELGTQGIGRHQGPAKTGLGAFPLCLTASLVRPWLFHA